MEEASWFGVASRSGKFTIIEKKKLKIESNVNLIELNLMRDKEKMFICP